MRNHGDDVVEIEVRAPSVSQAIQKGLIELGVSRDDVNIEVLSEGSRGLLGFFGAEDARVRLRLRRPRLRQPEPKPETPPSEAPPTEAVKPAPEAKAVEVISPEPITEEVPEPPAEARTPIAVEIDPTEIAIGAVQTLIRKLGVREATVELRRSGRGTRDNPIYIDVKGENLGVLIGHQGSTLHALQYITRMIVSRQTHERAYVVIDIDGYRQRREQSLRELAQRMANQVRRNGRPISLEAMPASDRRIIHLTLRDDPDVTTRSVGQGDNRKVTIRPRHPSP